MASFTSLHKKDIENFLALFDVGELSSFQEIVAGIENTNYFVNTTKYDLEQQFVLTLVEVASFSEVPFYTNLTTHLANYGLPVPAPVLTLDGMPFSNLKNKPALFLPKLPGAHLQKPNAEHCREVGRILGLMHSTLLSSSYQMDNPYNADWMYTAIEKTDNQFEPELKQLLLHCTEQYEILETSTLPRGIIHGDLFRDNILFSDKKITGVLDFFHACTDFLIMDVAITINDWCQDQDHMINSDKAASLLMGYELTRPLEQEEKLQMPVFQRIAAARFALTRSLTGQPGNHLKDPMECLTLLQSML
ncbi:MAG: homoserine kinase [Gammaproteobacteria bacterium]|nr:homoserine kinase [Gammaproteobacteria bacterium]MBT5202799.1 homoserine kinase [Gammaproteobacteria bacterium]MBT6246869.1 homoserine kinase [Gammaproteobacteria bacterium]